MAKVAGTVTAKRWIVDQKENEMAKYSLVPEYKYVDGYYADRENDTVTMHIADIVKETEKAVCFAVCCETFGGHGHSPFNCWLPKSQIINIEAPTKA